MSRVRKEARLSGMLLARKGSAQPAHTDHKLMMQAVEQEVAVEIDKVPGEEFKSETGDKSILVEAVKEINNVTKRQYNNVINPPVVDKQETTLNEQKIIAKKVTPPEIKREVPSTIKKVSAKRIAMTLRMEQEDHLKLRLFAAHSRKTCQEIISAALEMYLNEDEEVCGLSDCNCLRR